MSFIGKCGHCHHQVQAGEKYINCDLCKNSTHATCENLDDKKVAAILKVKSDVIWLCSQCKAKDPLNLVQLIPGIVEHQQDMKTEIEALNGKLEALLSAPKAAIPKTLLTDKQNSSEHNFFREL